jgi:cullin 3
MQQSQEGERLLRAVHKVWSDHTDCMDKLSHILKYMVRPTTSVIATNLRTYVLRTAYM